MSELILPVIFGLSAFFFFRLWVESQGRLDEQVRLQDELFAEIRARTGYQLNRARRLDRTPDEIIQATRGAWWRPLTYPLVCAAGFVLVFGIVLPMIALEPSRGISR